MSSAAVVICAKAPITTSADDSLEYFFSGKIRLGISCESSALFYNKKIKVSSAAILLVSLRIK